MTLRCIIIDDEQPARDELTYLLSAHEDIEVAGEADSVSAAVKIIFRIHPEFIFLDIQMRGKDGFEVLSGIRSMENPPLVIFTTAYDQYAVKAFETRAVDYLMKPLSSERLAKSLDRIRELASADGEDRIREALKHLVERPAIKVPVEDRGRVLLLDPTQIIFCQCQQKTILVHTHDTGYVLHGIQTLDQLEKHLGSDLFFRNHRSTLVNFDQIREFSPWFNGKYHIRMKNRSATELVVTRDRVRRFKQLLGI